MISRLRSVWMLFLVLLAIAPFSAALSPAWSVHLSDGTISDIRTIMPGDSILTYDYEDEGYYGSEMVSFVPLRSSYAELRLDDGMLIELPLGIDIIAFRSDAFITTPLKDISVQDQLLTVNGLRTIVSLTDREDIIDTQLLVLDSHPYYFLNSVLVSGLVMQEIAVHSQLRQQSGLAASPITAMATMPWSPGTPPQNRLLEFPDSKIVQVGAVGASYTHQYICYDNSIRYEIAECCGADSCNTDLGGLAQAWGGEVRTTGESINFSDAIYYCTSYGELKTDLDTIDTAADPDGTSCESAELPDGTFQDLTWTGGLCCGEADDDDEFYNDPGNDGICWNNTAVDNNNHVEKDGIELRELIAFDGRIYGCNIAETTYKPGNEYLLALKDHHTGASLITDTPMCELKVTEGYGNNFLCTLYGSWDKVQEDEVVTKSAPVQLAPGKGVQSSCCTPDTCWDGYNCIGDQSNATGADNLVTYPLDRSPLETGFRCIGGEWVEAPLKTNNDGTEVGYCPLPEQCLVTAGESANPANNDKPEKAYTDSDKPMCVDDGAYFFDYYCDVGKWTSRSRFIATAMVEKMAKEQIADYTLYCGDYDDVLPEHEGKVVGGCIRENVQVPCMNTVCAMAYEDEVLIGSSYNVPLDSDVLFNDPAAKLCRGKMLPSGMFTRCSNEASFNPDIESIIYNKFGVGNIYGGWFIGFVSYIKNKMISMLESIKLWGPEKESIDPPVSIDVSWIADENYYSRIFISKSGAKEVVAMQGMVPVAPLSPSDNQDISVYDYIAVEYKGFDGLDICEYVSDYDERFREKYAGGPRGAESLSCTEEGSTYYIFSEDGIGYDVWKDITARIRI